MGNKNMVQKIELEVKDGQTLSVCNQFVLHCLFQCFAPPQVYVPIRDVQQSDREHMEV